MIQSFIWMKCSNSRTSDVEAWSVTVRRPGKEKFWKRFHSSSVKFDCPRPNTIMNVIWWTMSIFRQLATFATSYVNFQQQFGARGVYRVTPGSLLPAAAFWPEVRPRQRGVCCASQEWAHLQCNVPMYNVERLHQTQRRDDSHQQPGRWFIVIICHHMVEFLNYLTMGPLALF